jgi:hypothetical protein
MMTLERPSFTDLNGIIAGVTAGGDSGWSSVSGSCAIQFNSFTSEMITILMLLGYRCSIVFKGKIVKKNSLFAALHMYIIYIYAKRVRMQTMQVVTCVDKHRGAEK